MKIDINNNKEVSNVFIYSLEKYKYIGNIFIYLEKYKYIKIYKQY
jgi:hypothetical protein